jgi:hypothetical protein
MRACPLCEHPQREAIDHDLHAQIDQAVLAVRYRVRKAFLAIHAEHLVARTPVSQGMSGDAARHDSIDNRSAVPVIQKTRHAFPLDVIRMGPVDEMTDESLCAEPAPETPEAVLKLGLPYVRRAVQLAGPDRLAQERIVATLNEVLRADDMGL